MLPPCVASTGRAATAVGAAGDSLASAPSIRRGHRSPLPLRVRTHDADTRACRQPDWCELRAGDDHRVRAHAVPEGKRSVLQCCSTSSEVEAGPHPWWRWVDVLRRRVGRRWGVSRPIGPVRGRRRWVGTRVPRLRPSECPPRRLHPLLRLCRERLIVGRPAQLGEPLLRRRPVRVGVDWSRPPPPRVGAHAGARKRFGNGGRPRQVPFELPGRPRSTQ